MCINYSNERMQSFFVTLKLSDEKEWYENEGLDIPFVEFLDNSCIIGMNHIHLKFTFNNIHWFLHSFVYFYPISDLFHNQTKGLLNILNDECKRPRPSAENFTHNLMEAWKNDRAAPISWKKSKTSIFLIKHFTNDVTYSTVSQLIFRKKTNGIIESRSQMDFLDCN